MKIIFFILLVLKIGRCTDDLIFETKTIGVGQNITLTCTRQTSWRTTYLFWIRVVSGTFPEILGSTIAYDKEVVEETDRVTATQEPGAFVLHITKTQFSDTAVYYCIKVIRSNMTFSKGIFLRVIGSEPDITAVTQDFPSDPVRPGDSVTLQCSVLFDSEKKTCPGEHSVFWFRAGSDKSHPSLIYAQRNNSDGCEKSPEVRSQQKCVYSFSKNVSSSDAGTYYCAVATCGEILFGNGTKLDIEVGSTCDSQNDNTIVFLLCAALAISLIVIAFLVYAIRKKSCNCCNVAATLQTNDGTASGNQQSQQRNEDTLVYCTPVFTRRKAGNAGRRNQRKEETIYTDIRASVRDQ
ncbi:signal-regulatory protein beta-2-like isoform X1 [Sebastes umbrosus]|uniref:signal-regulatory protein beta-2-like isoform X1 n=1 Tax=Sebastes umbrosus TaxID=72105 RepID=UPI00189E8366|nr:signal-regulatory protein beta-2-like isoform X1 [Sebastes umbrosus]